MLKSKNFLRNYFIYFLVIPLIINISLNLVYAQQEVYPTKPIQMIVPFPAGGLADITVRAIGNQVSKILEVPIVVINKSGAGGALGTDFVAKSKPDGYTLLGAPNAPIVIGPAITPNLSYKSEDLFPISLGSSVPNVFYVKKDAPWKNIEELISDAKKNPGKFNYGSAGQGTVANFTMEIFKISSGIDVVHVPFTGGGAARSALLGGHVNLVIDGLSNVISLIKSGDVRALAITTSKRLPDLSNVPTIAEKGFPEASLSTWTGFFAPAATPKIILDKLSNAFEKATNAPAIVNQLEKLGFVVDYKGPKDFKKLIENEYRVISDMAKKAGLIRK